jgi:hypothetical protein
MCSLCWHRVFLLLTLLTGALILFACQSGHNGVQVDPPELYVLATTPTSSGRAPETRVSYDGRNWSGPNFARNSQGVPIAAQLGVPSGVGTNFQKYLLAFFDDQGHLHTQESFDGVTWTNDRTEATFNVDQHSRPAIAYDHKTSRWYIAFRESDGRVTVRSFHAPTGQGTSLNRVPDVTTTHAIGFAITTEGLPANATHSRLLLAYREGNGTIRMKETLDPENWPSGVGTDTRRSSESGPFLDTAFGLLRLGLTGTSTPPQNEDPFMWGEGTGRLSHGTVSVAQSRDGTFTSWERVFFIDGGTTAAGFSPSFAGPRTGTVSAKGNYPLSTTSIWFSIGNVLRIAGLPPRAEPHTETGLDSSMTFGQDRQAGSRTSPFRHVTLVFRRFHRGVPDRRNREDVTLEVEHYGVEATPGSGRSILARMNPWEIEDARKDATVQWSQGHNSQFPRFTLLMQVGDQVLVKVTGDDGTVSQVLTFQDIDNATRSQGDVEIGVNRPSDRTSYSVFYIAELQ